MDKQKERQEKIILGGKSIMISDTSLESVLAMQIKGFLSQILQN